MPQQTGFAVAPTPPSGPYVAIPATQPFALSLGGTLGGGYDQFQGRADLNSALQPATELGAPGNIISYSIVTATTASEFASAIHVDASASFAGGIGFSASANWNRSLTYNRYACYLLARVSREFGNRRPQRYELKHDTAKLLKHKEFGPFLQRFGDRFISAYTMGGVLWMLYEFLTETTAEQQELQGKLNAAVGSFGASVEWSTKMKSVQDVAASRLSLIASGTSQTPKSLSYSDLLSYALEFPGSVSEASASIIGMTAQSYSRADGFPSNVQLPFESNYAVYEQLAAYSQRLASCKTSLQYLTDNLPLFGISPTKLQEEAHSLEHSVAAEAHAILEDPNRAASVPDDVPARLAALEASLPERAPTEYGASFGELVGGPFDDFIGDKNVRASRRIRKIYVRSGAVVDGFAAYYQQRNGADFTAGLHGNPAGGTGLDFILADDEFLTTVRIGVGTAPYGRMVNVLQFCTNKGRWSPVFGTPQHEYTQIDLHKDGSYIVGFTGWSTPGFLEALGAIFSPLPS